MGMYNSELNTNSKENLSREKKRKTIRKAKNLSRIDDPKKLKKETKGLTTGQKRKVNRLRKRILRKESRKSEEERLRKGKRNVNQSDSKPQGEPNDPNARGLDKYRQEDINKPEKISTKTFKDRVGRSILKIKVHYMKARNKDKQRLKIAMNLLGFGAFGTMLVGMLFAILGSLLTFGAITSIMLSHPEAIKEIKEAGLLGNALELGNVAKDVKDEAGEIIVKGKEGTTGGNFDWYGVSADGSGDTSKEPTAETPTETVEKGVITGEDAPEQVWNYLTSSGFNDYGAAGIMGNLQQESGVRTEAVNPSGGASGIAQWKDGRLSTLKSKASEEGVPFTDLKLQMDYLVWELEGGESTAASILTSRFGGLDGVKKASDIKFAVKAFHDSFERSGETNLSKREGYAQGFYDKYAK